MTHTNQHPSLLLLLQEERDSDIARDDSDALTLCTIHQVREASEYLLGARVAKGRDWPNPNPNPNPNQAKGISPATGMAVPVQGQVVGP